MRSIRRALLIAGLFLAIAGSAQAQSPQPLSAALPSRFESWQAAGPLSGTGKPADGQFVATSWNRKHQALLGGVIGAAAGVVFCTTVSTLTNDSADGGLSFCPLDSYLLIGGAGFVLGAAIGWVI
jgi:hypothetical protein